MARRENEQFYLTVLSGQELCYEVRNRPWMPRRYCGKWSRLAVKWASLLSGPGNRNEQVPGIPM